MKVSKVIIPHSGHYGVLNSLAVKRLLKPHNALYKEIY